MSDYIERKSIRNLYSCLDPEDKVRVAQVLIDIDAIPSDDAVSVVRCKDCKYAHMTYGGDCKYCDMWKDDDDFYLELYLDGDFYCSYGERKETGHE